LGHHDFVKTAGLEVFRRLSVHPGVRAALERVANAGPQESSPIYLHLTTDAAEALPFETIFIPNRQFLALDERTPIVRIAYGRQPKDGVIERLCELPLRVTAVISAADHSVYEEGEWRALYRAFETAPLDFRLQVLVGRQGLREIIAQTNDARIEVHSIDDDVEALVRAIGEFEPVVLHFFCHGTTEPAAYLEVASRATHDLGDEPLYLSQDEIRRVARSLWIVTLNACEGAAPVQDAYSLALTIANNGVPAVVGMRESIDAEDANLFTEAFYQELLQELNRVFSTPQGDIPDWPLLMRTPRDRLRRRQGGPLLQAAAAHKRWTLPVLFMRPEKLHLRRIDGESSIRRRELFGELETLRDLRIRYSQDTPQAMLDDIDRRIAVLEQQLSA